MSEPFEIETLTERVILVGICQREGDDTEDSLQELAQLADTAGAVVAGTMIQNRDCIHPGTL